MVIIKLSFETSNSSKRNYWPVRPLGFDDRPCVEVTYFSFTPRGGGGGGAGVQYIEAAAWRNIIFNAFDQST